MPRISPFRSPVGKFPLHLDGIPRRSKAAQLQADLTLDEKKVIYQRSEERFVMYLLSMVGLQLGVGICRSLASEVIPLGDQLASIVPIILQFNLGARKYTGAI